jgi:hypothetical protein
MGLFPLLLLKHRDRWKLVPAIRVRWCTFLPRIPLLYAEMICIKCKKEIKAFEKETGGVILILSIFPYVAIFGVNLMSMIFSSMFMVVGLRWIITKPSRSFICRDCQAINDQAENRI